MSCTRIAYPYLEPSSGNRKWVGEKGGCPERIEYLLRVGSNEVELPVTVSVEDRHGNSDGRTGFLRWYDEAVSVTLTCPVPWNREGQSVILPFKGWFNHDTGERLTTSPSVTVSFDDHCTKTVYAKYGTWDFSCANIETRDQITATLDYHHTPSAEAIMNGFGKTVSLDRTYPLFDWGDPCLWVGHTYGPGHPDGVVCDGGPKEYVWLTPMPPGSMVAKVYAAFRNSHIDLYTGYTQEEPYEVVVSVELYWRMWFGIEWWSTSVGLGYHCDVPYPRPGGYYGVKDRAANRTEYDGTEAGAKEAIESLLHPFVSDYFIWPYGRVWNFTVNF